MAEQKAEQTPEQVKEAADRAAALERFKAGQVTLLTEVGAAYATMEKNRSKDMLAVARKCADYVDNAIRHASESGKVKAKNKAADEIEAALKEHTDESVGVSRLLGVYGLACVLDDKEVIGRIPVSILKVLLPLIAPDTTAPGLAYVWKSPELEAAGVPLVCDCAAGKHTVLSACKARDAILAKEAGVVTADAPAGDNEPKSPAQKAAQKVAVALESAGKVSPEARTEAVGRLVRTNGLSVGDIVAAIEALGAQQKYTELKTVLTAGRAILERVKAANAAKPQTAKVAA